MKSKPDSTHDYLSLLPEPQRQVLEKLRATIRSAAPGAVECISYSLPAFRLDGRLLVAFGAASHGGSFYPMSAATIRAHASSLTGFACSKGAIRFSVAKPLPASLVRTLVAARVRENRERAANKPERTPRPASVATGRVGKRPPAKSAARKKGASRTARPPRTR